MTASHDAETFVITRVFAAPRQRVWDAWTQPEQLGRWFGPKGTKTTTRTFDLKPGGMLHAYMDNPDGGRMWAKFVYREVEPTTRLSWAHSFSDEAANVVRAPFNADWPLELLTVVTFEDEGPRGELGTRVTLTWTPLNASEAERRTFAENMGSMNQGWSGSFDVLDAFLTQG
jgi:uncharacterized protein YndB with AHSA1/START domain